MSDKNQDQGYKNVVTGAQGILRILIMIFLVLFLLYAGRTAYSFGYSIFNQESMENGDGKDITVVIPEDTSVYGIAKILKSKGLIKDTHIFYMQERLSKYHGTLRSGTYILNTSKTADEIMEILAGENTEGQPQNEESSTSSVAEDSEASSDS